jgi:hypothetical protein
MLKKSTEAAAESWDGRRETCYGEEARQNLAVPEIRHTTATIVACVLLFPLCRSCKCRNDQRIFSKVTSRFQVYYAFRTDWNAHAKHAYWRRSGWSPKGEKLHPRLVKATQP